MQYPDADTGIDTLSVIRFILFALVINFTRPYEAKQSTPHHYTASLVKSWAQPTLVSNMVVPKQYLSQTYIYLISHILQV